MSWRVHLLPFLEKNDVYQKLLKDEFPLAEGADAGAAWNRPDLAKLKIAPFLSPTAAKSDALWLTRYRVFLGKSAAFDPVVATSLPRSFRDGSSNTLMLVEAGDPIPWTKSDEIRFDPQQALPKLKGPYAGGVYAAFADASVCFIPDDIDEKRLRALITRDGGETVEGLFIKKEDMDRMEALAESDQPAVKMTPEEAKQRLQTINDLKQMALSMHIFQDAHRKGLPPADGEPHASAPNLKGLSWRAHLLPFMEKQDVYFKLLKDGYPLAADAKDMLWNRPGLNKEKLHPFTPSVPGKASEPWHTYYRVFVGPGTAFEKKELKLGADFPDGLSQTILIAEAGEAVPWPKPEELVYDPKKPLPKLGGQFTDGFYAAFADGSVRFIPRDTDEKTIRAMITRNGGDTIDNLPPPVDTKKLGRLAGAKDL